MAESQPAEWRAWPWASLGSGPVIDPDEWTRDIPAIWDHVRKVSGEKIELMQHLHGQLPPIQTICVRNAEFRSRWAKNS